MTTMTLEAFPEEGTLPLPLQPVQTYLVSAPPKTGDVTDEQTPEPALCQPWPVGVPWREFTVRRYWVFQFQVMLEGADIMKLTEVSVPEAGADPVPFHPVHTYLVPAAPETGDATSEETLAPESYQPSPVGLSCAEFTVK